MNLYAIDAFYAPGCEVVLFLAKDDDQAREEGVYVAANDVDVYGSPAADVYCVARDIEHIGVSHATDAPPEWEWAHPAVEEAAFKAVCDELEHGGGE